MSEHQCDTCGKALYTRADGEKHLRYMQALTDIDRLRAENERLTRELAEARIHPSIVEAVRADREKLRAILTRYRTETPLGHQPHMIADEVDAALAAKE